MKRLIATTAASLVALAFAFPAGAQGLKQQLVGTWMLTSGIEKLPDGKTNKPWSHGTLMLDAGGHLAFFLIGNERPKAGNDPRVPLGPMVGYYGTYTVDEAKKMLTYSVEFGASPIFDNSTREQSVVIDGDNLTLTGSPVKTPQGDIIPVNEFKRAK